MNEQFYLTDEVDAGERIDKWLCENADGLTRSAIQRFCESGGVLAMSFNTHVTRREGLVRLFEKAGFEIVQTANLEHWVEQAISRDVILARKP